MPKDKAQRTYMKIKNNFTQIPNKLFEALMRAKLSGSELRIVLTICRDTYGWQSKSKAIGYTGFVKQTDIPKSYVIELVEKLKQAKVIVKYKGENHSPNSYSINENVENWLIKFNGSQLELTSPKALTSEEGLSRSSQPELTSSGQSQLTQEINKESKERSEILKTEIREKHSFLRKGDSSG